MGEKVPRHDLDEVSDLQYAVGAAANVLTRWRLYERAETPDPRYEVIDNVIEGDEIVVDAGCGSGYDLLRLATKDHPHRGTLIGQEISTGAFGVPLLNSYRRHDTPVELILGDTADLPFPDSSVDVVLAMFMLYHVPDPASTLKEFRRILRSNGTLIVGTSGQLNKPAHRIFEMKLAADFGIPSLAPFNDRFSGAEAIKMLNVNYEIGRAASRIWKSRFLITHTEESEIADDNSEQDSNYQIYQDSLMTMKANFKPPVQSWVWKAAFNKSVKPIIIEEIKAKGYFEEFIDRTYYVCRPKR